MTKLSDRLATWADHVANDERDLCLEAADLLDECEQALEWISRRCAKEAALAGMDNPPYYSAQAMYDAGERARSALIKLRAAQNGNGD